MYSYLQNVKTNVRNAKRKMPKFSISLNSTLFVIVYSINIYEKLARMKNKNAKKGKSRAG